MSWAELKHTPIQVKQSEKKTAPPKRRRQVQNQHKGQRCQLNSKILKHKLGEIANNETMSIPRLVSGLKR